MDKFGMLMVRICWGGVAVCALLAPNRGDSIALIMAVLLLTTVCVWRRIWVDECLGLVAALLAIRAVTTTWSLPETAGAANVINVHPGVLFAAIGTAAAVMQPRLLRTAALSRIVTVLAVVLAAISFLAYEILRQWYVLDDATIRRSMLHCLLTAAAFASAPALLRARAYDDATVKEQTCP